MVMSTQDIFDRVVGHMRSQGNPWGSFAERRWGYINPENPCERCAKGILMDCSLIDNKYVPVINGAQMWYGMPIESAVLDTVGRLITQQEKQLLNNLELVFEWAHQDDWESRFKNIAEAFELNYSKLIKSNNKESTDALV